MREFPGTLPSEVIGIICRQLIDSTALASRADVLRSNSEVIGGLSREMKAQVRDIYEASDRLNYRFWRFMFNEPEPGLGDRFDYHSSPTSSRKEATAVIILNRVSWCSTPGAMETMIDLRLAVWCPMTNSRLRGRSDPRYDDP